MIAALLRPRALVLLAAAGSAGLLLAALAFEHLGGLAPCPLCIWQRWPHVVALAGALAVVLPGSLGGAWWALVGAGGAATSGGIGVYHAGVEQGWWSGPTACAAAQDLSGMSAEDLLEAILAAPVVRCDEIPWEMFGLSMAAWNAVASFALAGVWLASLRRA
ncbi:MAG: disulfide bond formation protein B [Rhodobacteraceae bacterium]|nr:disulfide bond formation protein B [Paracoccaceae bacterium]